MHWPGNQGGLYKGCLGHFACSNSHPAPAWPLYILTSGAQLTRRAGGNTGQFGQLRNLSSTWPPNSARALVGYMANPAVFEHPGPDKAPLDPIDLVGNLLNHAPNLHACSLTLPLAAPNFSCRLQVFEGCSESETGGKWPIWAFRCERFDRWLPPLHL